MLSRALSFRAIKLLGVEEGLAGSCGRFLSRFSCFRRQQAFTYSTLATDANDAEDDDELLFGLDDTNTAGAEDTEVVFEK